MVMKNVIGMFLALLIGALPVTASAEETPTTCKLSKVCKKKGCSCVDTETQSSCTVKRGKRKCKITAVEEELELAELTAPPSPRDLPADTAETSADMMAEVIPLVSLCSRGKLNKGSFIRTYKEQRTLDKGKQCSESMLKRYRNWNQQIKKILVKLMCSWEDIQEFKKVESLKDVGCTVKPKEVAKVAEIPLAPMPKLAVTMPPREESHYLGTFGIVIGGVGVLMLGGGGVVGAMADSDAKSARTAEVQLETHDFNQQAASKASTANILLGVGAAVAVLGAGIAIIDWVILDDNQKVKVSASPTGAHLTIRW